MKNKKQYFSNHNLHGSLSLKRSDLNLGHAKFVNVEITGAQSDHNGRVFAMKAFFH
jgi:hypothetical protein